MIEKRVTPLGELEKRVDADGRVIGISGYAVRFYDASNPGTEFRMSERVFERIAQGSIRMADDVTATFNHNPNQLLGRQSSGTARFSIDNQGMRFDIDLPNTQTGRDVAELTSRGDVQGASFAFQINGEDGESVTKDGDRYVRELRSITIFEAGPVVNPAYAATSVDMRSVEDAMANDTKEDAETQHAARQRHLRLVELTPQEVSG